MKEDVEKAIKTLVEKSVACGDGNEALKMTQAALNLAHTLATLSCIEHDREQVNFI